MIQSLFLQKSVLLSLNPLMGRVTNPLGSDLFSSFVRRSQTGNGTGRLCDDCREGGKALPHDDDQESAPDQGSTQEAQHCAQVLHGKVSFFASSVPGFFSFQECDCNTALFTRGSLQNVVT